jgi:hypothetical protein
MSSGYVTYQAGLARIDDLRRQADDRRRHPISLELATAGSTVQRRQRLQPTRSPLGHALGILRGRRAARA